MAITVVTGFSLLGPPVEAQLPPLPPLTLVPTDPNATTTTLLPPLLSTLVPEPTPGDPPATLLPPLTAPPARKTTTFKQPPIPPSTPVRAAPVAKTKTTKPVATSLTGIPANQVEGAELGEADTGYSDLPFASQDTGVPTDETTELGIESSARDQVGSLASVAAGLLVFVLFGIAVWVRGEVRRDPADVRWLPDTLPW